MLSIPSYPNISLKIYYFPTTDKHDYYNKDFISQFAKEVPLPIEPKVSIYEFSSLENFFNCVEKTIKYYPYLTLSFDDKYNISTTDYLMQLIKSRLINFKKAKKKILKKIAIYVKNSERKSLGFYRLTFERLELF